MKIKTDMNFSSHFPPTFWKLIFYFLSFQRGYYILFLISAIATGFWGVFNALLIKTIIDNLEYRSAPDFLYKVFWPSVLFVVNFEAHNLAWRLGGYINYKIQPILKNNIITTTFAYIHNHTQKFFQERLAGRIGSYVMSLSTNIEWVIHDISRHLIRVVTLIALALISMYKVHPTFFLGLSIWVLIFSVGSIYLSHRSVSLSERYSEKETIVAGQVVDSVTNAFTVRVFARRLYEIKKLQKILMLLKKAFQSKELFLIRLHFFQGLSLTIMLIFMLWSLIALHERDLVTRGDFALILGLSVEVGYMVWWGLEQVDNLNKAMGQCKQSIKSLFTPYEIKDKPNSKPLIIKKGEICFDSVEFGYTGSPPIFSNLSLHIVAGSKVGLVGYSGSGKSTFINLILRLYDIQKGQILIDGQNIQEVTQDSLRSSIGLIPQETNLFHRSLWENLKYGCPAATEKEVMKAAKLARAHGFIMSLPEGYQFLVGERGVKLSGGQRQRIGIARALLKDAPILILDEATSQLDSVTEREIQQALGAVMKNKTTLVIAHRLSTLNSMDRVLVFDHGSIVQDGPHGILIKEEGLYKKLWESQIGGLLPVTP